MRDAEPVSVECEQAVQSTIAAIAGEAPVKIWKEGVSGSYLGETRAGLININFNEPTCQGEVTSVEYHWLNPRFALRIVAPIGSLAGIALSQRQGSVILSIMDRRDLTMTAQLNDIPTIVHVESAVSFIRYRRTVCDPSHFAMINHTPIEYVDTISDEVRGPVVAPKAIYAQWCWQQMPGDGF